MDATALRKIFCRRSTGQKRKVTRVARFITPQEKTEEDNG